MKILVNSQKQSFADVAVLKKITNFTGKHLPCNLFLIKLMNFTKLFQELLFLKNTSSGCFSTVWFCKDQLPKNYNILTDLQFWRHCYVAWKNLCMLFFYQYNYFMRMQKKKNDLIRRMLVSILTICSGLTGSKLGQLRFQNFQAQALA